MLQVLEALCDARQWSVTTKPRDPKVKVEGLVWVWEDRGEVKAWGYAVGLRTLQRAQLADQVERLVEMCIGRRALS